MTRSPDNLTLEAALDNLALAIARDGNRFKEKAKEEIVTPVTIRISGAGFKLESTVSMETARKVVQCINQSSNEEVCDNETKLLSTPWKPMDTT